MRSFLSIPLLYYEGARDESCSLSNVMMRECYFINKLVGQNLKINGVGHAKCIVFNLSCNSLKSKSNDCHSSAILLYLVLFWRDIFQFCLGKRNQGRLGDSQFQRTLSQTQCMTSQIDRDDIHTIESCSCYFNVKNLKFQALVSEYTYFNMKFILTRAIHPACEKNYTYAFDFH